MLQLSKGIGREAALHARHQCRSGVVGASFAELDQWFAEDRCSVSAIVAAEIRFGLERTLISDDQVFAQVPGLHLVQAS